MHPLLIRFSSIPSTQDWVGRWARLGAQEGLAVQALEQTAGRGRLERRWWSPPGAGLYLSVLLRPTLSLTQASQLTMLVALAAIDACQQTTGVTPQPKWPNDLVLHDRKLAGVLADVEQTGGRLQFAVLGLGLNVAMTFSGTPLAATAISLAEVASGPIQLEQLRDAYLAALADRYRRFREGESPHEAWRQHLYPLGRRVRVEQHGQPDLVGQAFDVHALGGLLVRDDAGSVHTVWAGDVVVATLDASAGADASFISVSSVSSVVSARTPLQAPDPASAE